MTRSTPDQDPCEIRSTRVFSCTRERLWQAMTVPWQLARWWGPKGFRSDFHGFDLRVGGTWTMTMIGPDGNRYPNESVFTEIVTNDRLTFEHQPVHFTHTATLAPEGNGTRLTWIMRFPDAKARAAIEGIVVPANEENFDRLHRLLASAPAESRAELLSPREIAIERRILAPVALVYRAWTDPDRLAQWWGPVGYRTTTASMDLKPGGIWRFTMHGPEGIDYPNRIRYEVVEPERRLVYVHDGEGDFADVHFRSEVTFVEAGGVTVVTLRSQFPTPEARDQAIERFGAIEGGKETLARLDAYVSGG